MNFTPSRVLVTTLHNLAGDHLEPPQGPLVVPGPPVENHCTKASINVISPVTINGQLVEQVTTYKYLGVHFDSQLQWAPHVEYVCSRISQRLHFLRRLRVHGVNKNVMVMFYRAAIESIIRYAITTWFGNLSIKLKSQLRSLINRAGKILGARGVPLLPAGNIR